MQIHSPVILSLVNPKQKIWGVLLALEPPGITLQGIELDSFDDFVRQVVEQDEGTVGMAIVFYPMHRVERLAADEASGSIPSLSDRFTEKTGITVYEHLRLETPKL